MSPLHRIDDRSLLTSVINGDGIYLGPAAVLEGLTEEQACAKPHGLPHSIADIVAHLCYWQEWANRCAVDGFTAIAEHSVDGWPSVSPAGWNAWRQRYLGAVDEARRIVAESDVLGEPLLPPGVQIPALAKESRGSAMLSAAHHNSHHMGQIVTLRRLIGLWPPPSGTITW